MKSMLRNPTPSQARLEQLYYEWEEHCYSRAERNEKHKPAIQGGKARYVVNPEVTRIQCTFPGCTFEAAVQR